MSYDYILLHACSNNIMLTSGTESFMKTNPDVIRLCDTVSEGSTVCNKDTGEGLKLRMWSRGHFFIVRSCGHIDQWHPIYRFGNDYHCLNAQL